MDNNQQAWNFVASNPNHSFEAMDQEPNPEQMKDKEMLPDPEMNAPVLVPDMQLDGVVTGNFAVPVVTPGQEKIQLG